MLLVTVRDDFYPELGKSPVFDLFEANHRNVKPLGREELREAIVRPAAQVGVKVEPALVELLLAQAGDELCVMPHLQMTLRYLWEERRQPYLSLDAYKRLGREGRSGLQEAMMNVADAAIALLNPSERTIAQRVFLRLVQFGEGRAATRRQQSEADLGSISVAPELLAKTLEHLAKNRLLTLSGEEKNGIRTVDMAHETLIVSWPTLGREAEQTSRRLEGKAAEWVRLGQGRGGLLDEVELWEAETWLRNSGGASEAFRALVNASRAAINRAVRNSRWSFVTGIVLLVGVAVAVVIGGVRVDLKQTEVDKQKSELGKVREELQSGQTQLSKSRNEVDGQKTKLRDERRKAHPSLALATQAACEAGDLAKAQELLEFQRPTGDDEELRGFEWDHWRRYIGPPRISLEDDWGEIRAFQFQDDKSLVAVTGKWQRGLQMQKWRWESDQTGWKSLAPSRESPRNKVIFTASAISPVPGLRPILAYGEQVDRNNHNVMRWDFNTTDTPRLLESSSRSPVKCLAISGSGIVIAGRADADRTIEFWAAGKPDRPSERLPASDKTPPVAFAFDCAENLAVAWQHDVKVFNKASDWKTSQSLDGVNSKERFTCIEFSQRGWLAAGTQEGRVYLWDETRKLRNGFPRSFTSVDVTCLCFAPQQNILAVGCKNGKIFLWDLDRNVLGGSLVGHNGPVVSLRFNSDGRSLASQGQDRKILIWPVSNEVGPETVADALQHKESVVSLAFSPDGCQLASASLEDEKQVKLWDMKSGQVKSISHPTYVRSVAFSPSGKWLVSGCEDGWIRTWNVATQERKACVQFPKKTTVMALAIAADGWLAAGGSDGSVFLFRLNEYGELESLPSWTSNQKASGVNHLAFSHDGKLLAIAEKVGNAGRITLWQRQGAELTLRPFELPDEFGYIWSVAFSRDERWLAAATDKGVLISDLKTGDLLKWDSAHWERVRDVAFSDDSSTLASAGDDGTLVLWNLTTRKVHARFITGDPLRAVAFTPPGSGDRVLAAAGKDGKLRFWRASTRE